MSRWVSLTEFLKSLTSEVAKTNVEMQTIQRMAWAESAMHYNKIARQDLSDEINQIRAAVLKDWHNENQLAIKEVKLSFTLKERSFFSRLGSYIAHPFSAPPPRYQLIPGKADDSGQNVEICFVQKENGNWENETRMTGIKKSEVTAPVL